MFAELVKRLMRIGNPAAASRPDYCVYTTEFDRIIHGDELPALLSPEQEAAFHAREAEVDPVLSQWRTAAELAAIEDVKAYAAKHSANDWNDTVACLEKFQDPLTRHVIRLTNCFAAAPALTPFNHECRSACHRGLRSFRVIQKPDYFGVLARNEEAGTIRANHPGLPPSRPGEGPPYAGRPGHRYDRGY